MVDIIVDDGTSPPSLLLRNLSSHKNHIFIPENNNFHATWYGKDQESKYKVQCIQNRQFFLKIAHKSKCSSPWKRDSITIVALCQASILWHLYFTIIITNEFSANCGKIWHWKNQSITKYDYPVFSLFYCQIFTSSLKIFAF